MKFILLPIILVLALNGYSQTACTEIKVPDVLTPNNDGINDYLVINCLENYPDNELTVYSRWGEIVYQSYGYTNNWDGYAEKNKSKLPDGTYVYILKVTIMGEEKTINGHLTIVR